MHKHDEEIKKRLAPDEKLIKTYEQSDAYIHENPFQYGVNIIILLSTLANLAIALYLALTDYTRFHRVEAAQLGGIFYIFNIILYVFSLTPKGNKLRGLKIGGFKYGYDYAHISSKDDKEDEVVNLRSSYSMYFVCMSVLCGCALHFYAIAGIKYPDLFIILVFCSGLLCLPLIFIVMAWRRMHRKVVAITDQRAIVYDLRTKRMDYIVFVEHMNVYRTMNDYTVSLHDDNSLRKSSFSEALLNLFEIRSYHAHILLSFRGVKKFEELYLDLIKKYPPSDL